MSRIRNTHWMILRWTLLVCSINSEFNKPRWRVIQWEATSRWHSQKHAQSRSAGWDSFRHKHSPIRQTRKEGRYKSAAEVAEKGIGGVVETMKPKFSPNEEYQNAVTAIMQESSNPPRSSAR
ncbi:MAG: hypothetical protein U0V48_14935 [Anaerolineales bacterium]